jgi:hypothetical protein
LELVSTKRRQKGRKSVTLGGTNESENNFDKEGRFQVGSK